MSGRGWVDGSARGATARGALGLHGQHAPRGDRLWRIGRRIPVRRRVIDSPDRVAASFQIVDELSIEHGLVTREMA